jgi:hypothetical protein
MATRKRRLRKQRGSRTCGWGTSGQHRDGGMKVEVNLACVSISGHM